LTSDEEISGALVHGGADVVLVVPHDFGNDLARGQTAKVQILLDGSESNSTALAVGYLGKILASFGDVALEKRTAALSAKLGGRAVSLPLVNAEIRFRFNPELLSAWYMVPGVLGMILMIVTMLMTSLAITREREIGTMEQLIVTPIRPWELLAGKMLPFALVGLVDVTLILLVAMGHFGLPMRGSLALLYLAAGVFLFTTLGMGLFLSTISHTQQQAMFSSFLFMMPAILLSGFMFPIDNMPVAIQYLTYANPLRYFLYIVRAVILKGCGWNVLAPQYAMMFLLGVILFGIASLRFRKTIQ
jgi:ABC-2 type transport system permease protein